MNIFATLFKRLWDMEVKAYHSLKLAIANDKTGVPVLVTDPVTGKNIDAKTHVALWFKASLVPIVVFAVIILLVWSFFNKTNPRDKRRNHHGVNEYGERY